jgi:flagellar biosynthesis protein FlhA
MAQANTVSSFAQRIGRWSLGPPIAVIIILGTMILPVPSFLLDALFSFNIIIALTVLLAAIYVKRPLDFAAFPTILLGATLLRLSLNVAAARRILLQGHEGTHAAGQVIDAFGNFVVGGNYAVGIVVFIIFIIINFVVVTRGAARISEVSARFTLDAMPGKQMAIDADLNAGMITQDEARKRREEIRHEADFYGAMDGASKFVRGDAIAAILILLIDIIGGLIVGVAQHDMALAEAAGRYTLLTVGEGLVTQVPALILSTAAGIIITRASTEQDLAQDVFTQLFGDPRALGITGGILAFLGTLPGMPHIPFLLGGAASAGFAFWKGRAKPEEAPKMEETPLEPPELTWEDVPPVDPINLEIGYRLIPLADKSQDGQLVARIKAVRKKLSSELGFLLPAIHVQDNLSLEPNRYRIAIYGVVAGEGVVYPDREFAISSGNILGPIDGIAAKDPAFGLDAVWIAPAKREEAQSLGYTVVDATTVIVTHLSQLLQKSAARLLGHEEAQQLLEQVAKTSPKLVENLVPKTLSYAVVLKVLQNLLQEGIPIRNIKGILEALAESANKTQDPEDLTAYVREQLADYVAQAYFGTEKEANVVTLEPQMEQILLQALRSSGGETPVLEPTLAERVRKALKDVEQWQQRQGKVVALVVSPLLRAFLARFARMNRINVAVLAYTELPQDKTVKVLANVG